jgi:hypothetical protein
MGHAVTIIDNMPSRLRLAARTRQLWAWTIGIIVYSALILRGTLLLLDPGTYWHIAVGRLIVQHHAIPFREPFSYTKAGILWSSHEWISELAIAIVYDVFGWHCVILFTALCGALAFGLFALAVAGTGLCTCRCDCGDSHGGSACACEAAFIRSALDGAVGCWTGTSSG